MFSYTWSTFLVFCTSARLYQKCPKVAFPFHDFTTVFYFSDQSLVYFSHWFSSVIGAFQSLVQSLHQFSQCRYYVRGGADGTLVEIWGLIKERRKRNRHSILIIFSQFTMTKKSIHMAEYVRCNFRISLIPMCVLRAGGSNSPFLKRSRGQLARQQYFPTSCLL